MLAVVFSFALQWGTFGCEPATSWQFARADNYASFLVDVPDGYELFVDGNRAVATTFRTPALEPGVTYRYTLSLIRNSDMVVSKIISFQAGQQMQVNFTAELAALQEKRKPATPINFGVDVARLNINETKITINGSEEVTYDQAKKIISAPKLPDHSKSLRLLVIGNEAQLVAARKIVEAIIGQDEKLVCKYTLPDSWTLKDNKTGHSLGFKTTGNPSCYLQKPGGEMLVYAEGLEQLKEMVTQLRQKNPNFDPNSVPVFSGGGIAGFDLKQIALGAIFMILLAGILKK